MYRLESTSIARALARKNDYKISYNREIIGLGVANFFGAAFNAYTTTGMSQLYVSHRRVCTNFVKS